MSSSTTAGRITVAAASPEAPSCSSPITTKPASSRTFRALGWSSMIKTVLAVAGIVWATPATNSTANRTRCGGDPNAKTPGRPTETRPARWNSAAVLQPTLNGGTAMHKHGQPLSSNGKKTVAKRFGRGRITGLALIAVLTLGLGYLHFSGSSTSVSVPAGAHAGQLTLKSCSYTTENGTSAADCGTLVVPENRHDPNSRLIALPVIVIHAHSAHPGVPIFRLQGGPGITNMVFPDASRFTANHDVVLVGYRGVDGSVRLDCPEVTSALENSGDLLSEQSFRAVAAAFRSCADRLRSDGVDLAGYSIPEEVDDLDAARRALGYHQIDLVSESAGTPVANISASRYPKSIHRSVMIGVNPPGDRKSAV